MLKSVISHEYSLLLKRGYIFLYIFLLQKTIKKRGGLPSFLSNLDIVNNSCIYNLSGCEWDKHLMETESM